MPPDAGDFSGGGSARSLRVLTPLHSFEPGGVERIAIRLHRAWTAAGIDSHLVFGRGCGPMRGEFRGLRHATLAPRWLATARWETLWLILSLPGVIRRVRPDVIFCAGNTYAIVMVAMRWLLGSKCPPILCKISNDLYRHDLPRVARWFYSRWLSVQARHIESFVALAPAMKPEMISLLNIHPDRIAVIPDPALTLGELSGRGTTDRHDDAGTHYLAIGRLVRQKNFSLLLNAYGAARAPADRLTILGDGPERAALEKRARDLGVADSVSFEGHVGDIRPYLKLADIFVLSSAYEGVPAVVLEALAACLPTVATDCCASMRDLVDHPRRGIVVPPGEPVAFGKAMTAARAIQFDQTAARTMLRKFTLEHAAPAYHAALTQIAHPREGQWHNALRHMP